jgi:hypothetical protein
MEKIMTDIFATAKKAGSTKKKGGKAEKERKAIPGLEVYSKLDALEKNIAALKEVARLKVDILVRELFIDKALATGTKPESFRGYEGTAEASVEYRKRSTASALNDVEKELLKTFNIPTEEVADRPETFIINPAYAKDNALLKKVGAALKKVDLPEDFLQVQEATIKTVVTNETLAAVFTTKKLEVVEALFSVVGLTAYKPVVADFDPAEAAKELAEMV